MLMAFFPPLGMAGNVFEKRRRRSGFYDATEKRDRSFG
jgi:hypothetical protein